MTLSPADVKVIHAFLDSRVASSKHLSSTGAQLNGNWMGGTGIANWKGDGKLQVWDIGSKSALQVIKRVVNIAPPNWFAAESAWALPKSARAAASRRKNPSAAKPKQSGLCPICGERVRVQGKTTDGRVYGSCGDAFYLTSGGMWSRKASKKNPGVKTYAVIDDAVFPTDTMKQIARAKKAMEASALTSVPLWAGDPNSSDSCKNGQVLFAAAKKNPDSYARYVAAHKAGDTKEASAAWQDHIAYAHAHPQMATNLWHGKGTTYGWRIDLDQNGQPYFSFAGTRAPRGSNVRTHHAYTSFEGIRVPKEVREAYAKFALKKNPSFSVMHADGSLTPFANPRKKKWASKRNPGFLEHGAKPRKRSKK